MRETRTGGKGRDLPHPKPVNKIDLPAEHVRLRLILAVAFLAVGAFLIAYSVVNLSSKDAGWSEIEVSSSELNCSGDFVFLYCLGTDGASAKVENKELTACYSNATEYAFQIFTNDVEYENVHNMYYINRHPNEEIEVDDILYRAFSLIQESGDRSLYLAPVYEQYDGLFRCTEEYQTVEYDPYQNQDVADYYAAIAGFANDAGMIDLELLGENRICLRVAGEYLDFASENEFESFIDFYWMKNAFIVDYLAEEILSAGYSRGCISSVDGFTRNLDRSGEIYAYTFYDRVDSMIYPAATVQYSGPSSIVYLHDYALDSGQMQYYYAYSNGELRTPYLDTRDGFCRSVSSDLVCYGSEAGCSEILLGMIPVYIADTLQKDALAELAGEGIFSIYTENSVICHNEADLMLTQLYRDENIRYEEVFRGPWVSANEKDVEEADVEAGRMYPYTNPIEVNIGFLATKDVVTSGEYYNPENSVPEELIRKLSTALQNNTLEDCVAEISAEYLLLREDEIMQHIQGDTSGTLESFYYEYMEDGGEWFLFERDNDIIVRLKIDNEEYPYCYYKFPCEGDVYGAALFAYGKNEDYYFISWEDDDYVLVTKRAEGQVNGIAVYQMHGYALIGWILGLEKTSDGEIEVKFYTYVGNGNHIWGTPFLDY